jgi:glutaredoxin-like protein NrdH
MKTLYIYTKNGCPECDSAKKYIKNLGIDYTEINASREPWARDWLISEGHKEFPIFYADEDIFMRGSWRIVGTMTKDEILDRLI